jgi:hypothetical protein
VPESRPETLRSLRGPGGCPLRVAHLTTVDMSLALLLETELRVDVESGLETFGISAAGPYVVPGMEPALRAWFRAAQFFRAKLVGGLGPERAYAGIVAVAKKVGARA